MAFIPSKQKKGFTTKEVKRKNERILKQMYIHTCILNCVFFLHCPWHVTLHANSVFHLCEWKTRYDKGYIFHVLPSHELERKISNHCQRRSMSKFYLNWRLINTKKDRLSNCEGNVYWRCLTLYINYVLSQHWYHA